MQRTSEYQPEPEAAMVEPDDPICEICEEEPAVGTWGDDVPVCSPCAEGAILDGHQRVCDFRWWR